MVYGGVEWECAIGGMRFGEGDTCAAGSGVRSSDRQVPNAEVCAGEEGCARRCEGG